LKAVRILHWITGSLLGGRDFFYFAKRPLGI
jgi:hypothetical protein